MLRLSMKVAAVACASLVSSGIAFAQTKTVKVAFIDPQSGLMAPVGTNILHSYQLVADIANREGWAKGIKFEIVPFDNKLSPQESLNALKAAIDQDIKFIVQGNGSSVALALSDGITIASAGVADATRRTGPALTSQLSAVAAFAESVGETGVAVAVSTGGGDLARSHATGPTRPKTTQVARKSVMSRNLD